VSDLPHEIIRQRAVVSRRSVFTFFIVWLY
jgi:hypothetical protein